MGLFQETLREQLTPEEDQAVRFYREGEKGWGYAMMRGAQDGDLLDYVEGEYKRKEYTSEKSRALDIEDKVKRYETFYSNLYTAILKQPIVTGKHLRRFTNHIKTLKEGDIIQMPALASWTQIEAEEIDNTKTAFTMQTGPEVTVKMTRGTLVQDFSNANDYIVYNTISDDNYRDIDTIIDARASNEGEVIMAAARSDFKVVKIREARYEDLQAAHTLRDVFIEPVKINPMAVPSKIDLSDLFNRSNLADIKSQNLELAKTQVRQWVNDNDAIPKMVDNPQEFVNKILSADWTDEEKFSLMSQLMPIMLNGGGSVKKQIGDAISSQVASKWQKEDSTRQPLRVIINKWDEIFS